MPIYLFELKCIADNQTDTHIQIYIYFWVILILVIFQDLYIVCLQNG